jgi:hypothetical protein
MKFQVSSYLALAVALFQPAKARSSLRVAVRSKLSAVDDTLDLADLASIAADSVPTVVAQTSALSKEPKPSSRVTSLVAKHASVAAGEHNMSSIHQQLADLETAVLELVQDESRTCQPACTCPGVPTMINLINGALQNIQSFINSYYQTLLTAVTNAVADFSKCTLNITRVNLKSMSANLTNCRKQQSNVAPQCTAQQMLVTSSKALVNARCNYVLANFNGEFQCSTTVDCDAHTQVQQYLQKQLQFWTTKYNAAVNLRLECSNAKQKFQSATVALNTCLQGQSSTKAQCDAIQASLDQAACNNLNNAAQSGQICNNCTACHTSVYNGAVRALTAAVPTLQAQMASVLQVQCYLNTISTCNDAQIQAGVEACRQNNYYSSQQVTALTTSNLPVAPKPGCSPPPTDPCDVPDSCTFSSCYYAPYESLAVPCTASCCPSQPPLLLAGM